MRNTNKNSGGHCPLFLGTLDKATLAVEGTQNDLPTDEPIASLNPSDPAWTRVASAGDWFTQLVYAIGLRNWFTQLVYAIGLGDLVYLVR